MEGTVDILLCMAWPPDIKCPNQHWSSHSFWCQFIILKNTSSTCTAPHFLPAHPKKTLQWLPVKTHSAVTLKLPTCKAWCCRRLHGQRNTHHSTVFHASQTLWWWWWWWWWWIVEHSKHSWENHTDDASGGSRVASDDTHIHRDSKNKNESHWGFLSACVTHLPLHSSSTEGIIQNHCALGSSFGSTEKHRTSFTTLSPS